MMKNKKGFTLIELLIVIAIIGILAGSVLLAIKPGDKIDKANKAKINSSLSTVPTAAMMIYSDDNYSFDAVCDKTNVGIDNTDVANLPDYKCNDSATGWAVEARIKTGSGDYYCVDSKDTGVSTNSASIGANTVCP